MPTARGLRKFQEMIAAQGGDPRVCEDLSLLPQAAVKRAVRCGRAGYVAAMDTQALGLAAQAMGAGRMRKEDKLDYSVGFVLPVRIGDRVEEDTELCTLYARNDAEAQQAEAAIRTAITFQAPPFRPRHCAMPSLPGRAYSAWPDFLAKQVIAAGGPVS